MTKEQLLNGTPAKRALEVEEAKAYLANTDYVVIKIAEGVATKEEYAEVLKKREEARNIINS